jgi:hypothetical protein
MRGGSIGLAAFFVAGCYLAHERETPPLAIDAAPTIDARDAATIDTPDAPFCPPGMPCDCFVGGELIWDHLLYNASDATTVSAYGMPGQGWGDDMHLEARCAGDYTIRAHVVSRGSRCEIATVQTATRITMANGGARARMPIWVVNDACANEALTMSGGETCVEISWTAQGGGTGSAMLGCFAPFGPYCFGGPGCFPGGVIDTGASGDWSF